MICKAGACTVRPEPLLKEEIFYAIRKLFRPCQNLHHRRQRRGRLPVVPPRKFIEFGGPNGGCGGKGGDVILRTEPNLTTLLELAYNPHIEAQNGEKGGTYNKTGRAGEDKIVLVPCGTIVKSSGHVLADLTEPGQEFTVAKGGMGGRGNQSFKTRNNTAPHLAENGQPGEEITLIWSLKCWRTWAWWGFPTRAKARF